MLRRQQWTGRFSQNTKLLFLIFGAMFCLVPFLASLKAPTPRSEDNDNPPQRNTRDEPKVVIVEVERSCPSPVEPSPLAPSPTPSAKPKQPTLRINERIKHDEVVHVTWSMAGDDKRRVSDTWVSNDE